MGGIVADVDRHEQGSDAEHERQRQKGPVRERVQQDQGVRTGDQATEHDCLQQDSAVGEAGLPGLAEVVVHPKLHRLVEAVVRLVFEPDRIHGVPPARNDSARQRRGRVSCCRKKSNHAPPSVASPGSAGLMSLGSRAYMVSRNVPLTAARRASVPADNSWRTARGLIPQSYATSNIR